MIKRNKRVVSLVIDSNSAFSNADTLLPFISHHKGKVLNTMYDFNHKHTSVIFVTNKHRMKILEPELETLFLAGTIKNFIINK